MSSLTIRQHYMHKFFKVGEVALKAHQAATKAIKPTQALAERVHEADPWPERDAFGRRVKKPKGTARDPFGRRLPDSTVYGDSGLGQDAG